MTNAQKFTEVFGYEPDLELCPFYEVTCPRKENTTCSDCNYLYGDWWRESYKGEMT